MSDHHPSAGGVPFGVGFSCGAFALLVALDIVQSLRYAGQSLLTYLSKRWRR